MLIFNPKKRISIDDALEHKYFHYRREEEMEKISSQIFKFEQYNETEMSINNLRHFLWNEIRNYHKDLKIWWGCKHNSKLIEPILEKELSTIPYVLIPMISAYYWTTVPCPMC